MSDETEIVTLLENWAEAVRARDMERILAHHGADMLMFDVPEPLFSRGMDEYRATWDLFFQYSPGGPRSFDLRDIAVTADGSVAFATAFIHIFDNPLRLTVGLRKEAGQWLIVHEHHSYAMKSDG
jgi:ketosteroid isomerase-like protein